MHIIICFNISQSKNLFISKSLQLLYSIAQNKNNDTTKLSHKQTSTHIGNHKDLLVTQELRSLCSYNSFEEHK
jgi:hypothetical protein